MSGKVMKLKYFISAQICPNFLHSLERQPKGVQLVEGVGLVASGLQIFTCLGSMFAGEVGDLFCDPIRQLILRRITFLTICIIIRLIIQGRFSTRLTI